MDCFGKVVVELNEEEAEQAIRRLVADGVEALAICFLWSFLAPEHEQRVKAMVERIAPDLFVTCSSELVPKWGEYERTAAVALNAYIGPLVTGYLARMDRRTTDLGYHHPLQITQCAGGTIPVAKAMAAPLLTLDSGPVSGVTGSRYAGGIMGYDNVITTDMGGTSFDVGIIHGGEPAFSYRSLVHQYEYYLSKVDIQVIGAGGGSMAWIDEATGAFRVGPESAGADPGPVCYGRGGTVPTVTDADLVLGYLDPDNFAGGAIKLDRDAAARALAPMGERLGLGLDETASGIARIAEFQMADLIRKVTIQKGHDPRDFVLFAFGGAGPAHAGVFAQELGVSKVIVPQRETASVWCAFGAAAADLLHVHERVNIMRSPFDAAEINAMLAELKVRGAADLAADDVAPAESPLPLHPRHAAQGPDQRGRGRAGRRDRRRRWDRRAARRVPPTLRSALRPRRGAAGRAAGDRHLPLPRLGRHPQAACCRRRTCSTRNRHRRPGAPPARSIGQSWGHRAETPIYNGARLVPGNRFEGPAVIDTEVTTVVVHPGQTLTVDSYGNFEIALAPERGRRRDDCGDRGRTGRRAMDMATFEHSLERRRTARGTEQATPGALAGGERRMGRSSLTLPRRTRDRQAPGSTPIFTGSRATCATRATGTGAQVARRRSRRCATSGAPSRRRCLLRGRVRSGSTRAGPVDGPPSAPYIPTVAAPEEYP